MASELIDCRTELVGDRVRIFPAGVQAVYDLPWDDFRAGILPEVWSLDGDSGATHRGWGHEGRVPVAVLATIRSPSIQFSRIEWEGDEFSWCDARCFNPTAAGSPA